MRSRFQSIISISSLILHTPSVMTARATFKDKQPLKTLARASQSCAKQVRNGVSHGERHW